MDKDINISGLWVIGQGATEQRLPGTLTFSDAEGGYLEVIEESSPLDFRHDLKSYDIISGRGDDGSIYYLYDAFDTNINPSNELTKIKIFANFIIKDMPVPSLEQNYINSAEIEIKYFNNWLLRRPFDIKLHKNVNYTVRFKKPKAIKCAIDDDISIEIRSNYSVPGGFFGDKLELNHVNKLVINSKSTMSVSKIMDIVHLFTSFLSFFINQPTIPLSVKLMSKKHRREMPGTRRKYYEKGELFYRYNCVGSSDSPPRPYDMLCTYRSVERNFANIIEKWFKIFPELSEILYLYNLSCYDKNIPFLHKFLFIAQAAETCHRRFMGGKYISDEKYKGNIMPYLEEALALLPCQDLANVIKGKIAWLHEFSLAKRLSDMCGFVMPAINDLLSAKQIKNVIRRSVDYRNILTHYAKKMELNQEKIDHILLSELMMKIITIGMILLQLGFTDVEINNIIKNQSQLMSDTRHYASMPNNKA